jgi:hypothetical protein
VGPRCRRLQRKKKKGRLGGLLAGDLVGRQAWLGRKVRGKLSFFSFLFQTPFKTTFPFKFKSNSFKLFLKNFINFLETTQATKNYASQLIMHNHLLSQCLLN